jgi:hypothetical protein
MKRLNIFELKLTLPHSVHALPDLFDLLLAYGSEMPLSTGFLFRTKAHCIHKVETKISNEFAWREGDVGDELKNMWVCKDTLIQ